MFTGGESWEALAFGSSSSIDSKNPDNLSYDRFGGMGLVEGLYLDTHFG